jgi:hypothetical protein
MVSNSTIALIIIIGLLIFIMFYGVDNTNKEGFAEIQPYSRTQSQPNSNKAVSEIKNKQIIQQNITKDKIIHDVASYFSDEMVSNYSLNSKESLNLVKKPLNNNFMDIQFHNDYRDVYTALLNIVPDKRQLFNIANIPITYSEPELNEVKLMLKDFIAVLNENINTEVPLYRNPNSGWDEAIVDPQVESGWDKAQKALGLPVSIYEKPAGNAFVDIIKVNKIQKYETEDEIKYAINFIIQKRNVDDQMIIKGSFVQDKRPIQDENNFFIDAKIDMKVLIEDLFIVGYLSNEGLQSKQQQLDTDVGKKLYYDIDHMEFNNLTDPKYVQKVLMDKYDVRLKETGLRNALLDVEGRDMKKNLPNMFDFSNISGTRTILDDFNSKHIWY